MILKSVIKYQATVIILCKRGANQTEGITLKNIITILQNTLIGQTRLSPGRWLPRDGVTISLSLPWYHFL